MNEQQFEEHLAEALEVYANEEEEDGPRSNTFDGVGMLTHNKGLVVKFPNGDEFQVTIVQSEEAESEEDDED